MKRARARPVVDASNGHTARIAPIAPAAAKRLARVFRSLSDPTRLRIISLLSQREYCVTDLVTALGLEQSTISHQLRDMRAAGWVRYRREGRRIFYALDDEHVRDLYGQALAHIGQG